MSLDRTSRDSAFRLWNIATLIIAVILIGIFSVQLSAQPTTPQDEDVGSSAGAGEAGVVVTDGRRLNARSGPGTTFAIVGKIEPSTSVQVLDASQDGAWLLIQANGLTDEVWVAAEYIADPATAVQSQTSTTQAVTDTQTDATQVNVSQAVTPQSTAAQPATTVPDTSQPVAGNDATVSLLPTVTPTPVGDSSAPEAGETGAEASSSRLLVQVAPLNLQSLTSRLTGSAAGAEASQQTEVENDAQTTDVTDSTMTSAALAPAATPVASPTPAATAPPQPTPEVATAFTQPTNMNVRSGPGTNFSILTSVPAGTGLEILAVGSLPGGNGDWYQVQHSGLSEPGWVFASLTQAQGPIENVARLNEDELPQPPAPPEPVQAAAEAAAEPAPASGSPLSAASTAAVAAPAPSGGAPFGYGVQAHMLGGGGDRSMDAISDLGFNWIKQQVQWKLFEPSSPGSNFGELHGIVNAAGSRGINVLFSVVDAPDWAREPGFDGSVGGPPADPQTYANFVGAMAGTFCGTSLKAIEVWNEQNLHYEWGNLPLSPADYMNLLRPAYAAIKAACPSMYVISGALTPAGSNPPYAIDDMQYLEGMYQHGLANYADGIGAHPSGYNVPPSVTWQGACEAIQAHGNSFNGACDSPHHSWSFRSTMEGYRNIMVTYGDANKKIWPTEFGWAAGGAFDPRYAYANDNSFDEQAAWTVEAFRMMKNWGWVGPAILWNLNFRVVADGTEKAQWGIVSNNWEPLPIYHALKAMPK
jgi:uncharacterized protein YgiM (DUF1202 family)